jgi:hypothetical protein
MTELACPVARATPDRPWAHLCLRLLDFLLLGALLGALLGVSTCSRFLNTWDYGRWSLSALLFGLHWGCEGARVGIILGTGWYVTRRSNVIGGVAAAVLLALVVGVITSVFFVPLSFVIVGSPEPMLPNMKAGLASALAALPAMAYQAVLIGLFASSISFLMQRRAARRAQGAGPSPAEAVTPSPGIPEPPG